MVYIYTHSHYGKIMHALYAIVLSYKRGIKKLVIDKVSGETNNNMSA